MKRPHRRRLLTEGEARLWGEIAKLITPLRGRAVPKGAIPVEPAAAPSKPTPVKRSKPAGTPAKLTLDLRTLVPPASQPKRPLKLRDLAPAPGAPPPPPSRVAASPPTANPGAPGLERRERRGLERGRLTIEARIDLHGLYQAEAHAALVGFLMRSRAAGHARVLVVTGKGGAGGDPVVSERGVLRRSVPHWLRGAELRSIVLGFEEAARHHGGGGALYVRLRRR